MELSQELKQKIEKIKKDFPMGRSALLPVLHAVQDEIGYIPLELEPDIAKVLGIPEEYVHEVSTFYFMFNNEAIGKYNINICGNISCWLRGFENLREHLEQKLSIKPGETSSDGKFTLTVVECLGMCDHAPVMQINGQSYGDLTKEKIDQILDGLK